MKIIFKIHPLSYILTLIFFLMGYFKIYLIFMFILIIHELGHIITSLYFKWKIDKIIILPFGLLIKYNELINRPIKEEFIIAISGILFQLLVFKINIYYSILIIIFNLLPIYPLDGSKILNLILNKITNFKLSYILTIYISYINLFIILIFIIINKDLIFLIIIIPLFIGLKKYKIKYIINKFYLERYLYKLKFKRIKIIKNINYMKRDYSHLIKNNNKYLKEEEILKNMFDK